MSAKRDSADDDDDSFSKVSLNDAGSDSGPDDERLSTEDSNLTSSPNTPQKVVVQLPPDFSARASISNHKESKESKDAFSLPSEVSSFIPVTSFGKLKVGGEEDAGVPQQEKYQPQELARQNTANLKRNEDDNESSDWSVVSSRPGSKYLASDRSTSTGAPKSDDVSVAASSAISDFDLLSLNDSSKKHCERCSFLNGGDDSFCQVCQLTLVADANLTADEKLARHLQDKEEREAFNDILVRERKRNKLGQQPLLFRAQTLADEVLSVVEVCRMTMPFTEKVEPECTGFCALPQDRLIAQASRFLEYMDKKFQDSRDSSCSPLVKLCYCFTYKDGWRMTQIRQDGFGPHAKFGSTPQAARKESASLYPGGSRLRTILEQDSLDTSEGIGVQGWIAAIVIKDTLLASKTVKDSSGTALVYTQKKSAQSLPLVSLDATMMDKDIVRRLVNGLTTAFHDYFGATSDNTSVESDDTSTESPKRRKFDLDSYIESSVGNGGETDDEALAMALQASLYEDGSVSSKGSDIFPCLTAAAIDDTADLESGEADYPFPFESQQFPDNDWCPVFDNTIETALDPPTQRPEVEPVLACPIADGDMEATVGRALNTQPNSGGNSFSDATEEPPPDADLDGLVTLGVEADDVRVHNLEMAAASFAGSDA